MTKPLVKSVLLAAGQGTRLRPYTDKQPKCMVPLADVPLLTYQRAVLRQAGVRDITIVAGYQASVIPVEDDRVVMNPRYDQSNMVTTLFCAPDVFDGSADVLIAYTDIVYEPRVLEALLACDASVAVTVDTNWQAYWQTRMENPLTDAETLKLDNGGRILELGKKPQSEADIQAQYMGLIKIKASEAKKFLSVYQQLVSQNQKSPETYDGQSFDNMYMTSFIQHLIDTNWPVQSVPVTNGWLEVDTVQDLELYQQLQQEGKLKTFCDLAVLKCCLQEA